MSQQIRAILSPTSAFQQKLETGTFKITFKPDPVNDALAPTKPTYQNSIERWQDYLGMAAAAGHIGTLIRTTAVSDNILEITLPHSPLFRTSLSQQKYLAKVENTGAYAAVQGNADLTPAIIPT